MANYSVATTKDKLSSLIDKALAGEEVIITRHGKPTIRLAPNVAGAPKNVGIATQRLRARVGGEKSLAIPVEHFREWLYEDERY